MKFKSLFMGAVCWMAGAVAVCAQDFYDVTEVYLQNAGFDSGIKYDKSQTGNVAQEISDIEGWTKNISVDYTITGIYAFGTSKTFNGTPVPAKNYDGTAAGGCLALSTGWQQSLIFYQPVTLPPGKYALISAWYNPCQQTVGKSLVGWIPSSGSRSMSAISSFEIGKWMVDTIKFTVSADTKGNIQIGYGSPQNSGSGNHAKVVLDFVKLLRDTPVGDADANLKKHDLQAELTMANEYYGSGNGNGAATLKAAIDAAQSVYDNADASFDDVLAAIKALQQAVDTYLWANPTGSVPTVTTDTRFARGATMAFGRLSTSGADITERGFCISTNPEPTIADQRATSFYNHNGNIYKIDGLKPATLYYMRAYAITSGRQVGYGDVIKFYTIPKGNITWNFHNRGDAATEARITSAVNSAIDYFNNLTSVVKCFDITYSSGTPTADCNYKAQPWMNVGPNTSYQRTGTIMHEMQHGLGLVPYSTQWSKNILRERLDGEGRGTGLWLGDRVKEFLHFWDNNTTTVLNGDYQHMWPYGINGASEDNGSEMLYIANAMLCQALGEDGLEHTSNHFADPYYSFDCKDGVKYYLKNESTDCGLYSSFLTINGAQLEWTEMTNEEAANDDNAAWYITFTPGNQFYQLQNVGTGRYLSINGTLARTVTTAPSSNEDFHLMPGRVEAAPGTGLRGYWMLHHAASNPRGLSASSGGKVSTEVLSLANDAVQQRWLILESSQLDALEESAKTHYNAELDDLLKNIKALRATEHEENAEGTDSAIDAAIASIESRQADSPTASIIAELIEEARLAGFNFLSNATPSDETHPFDLTYMVKDAAIETLDGWTGNATLNYSCAEFYQSTFNFYQTLKDMPAGIYQLRVQAFQRPGSSADAYTVYSADPNSNITTNIYIASTSAKVKNVCAEALKSKVGIGREVEVGNGFIPNDMQSTSGYFAKGLYDNVVEHQFDNSGGSFNVGIRCTSATDMYWSIFDNFRLFFLGNPDKVTVDIKEVPAQVDNNTNGSLFTPQGVKLDKRQSLLKGIYIENGRKFVVK